MKDPAGTFFCPALALYALAAVSTAQDFDDR